MEKKDFSGYVASTYISDVIQIHGFAQLQKNYSFLYSFPCDSKILEFGPGRGYFIDWLLAGGFQNITLVDIDEENCLFLRNKYKNIETVKIIHTDALHFNDDAMFDIIVARQFLEHVPVVSIRDFLLVNKKRLSPSGVFICETINAANIVYGNYYRYIDFSHYVSFTEKSLKEFSFGVFNTEIKPFSSSFLFQIIKILMRGDWKNVKKVKKRLVLGGEGGTKKNAFILMKVVLFPFNYLRYILSIILSRFFISDKIVHPFFIAVFTHYQHESKN